MATFSERNGYTKIPNAMLPEQVTKELRNKLWNVIADALARGNIDEITFNLWHFVYKEPVDTRGEFSDFRGINWKSTTDYVRGRVINGPWNSVLDHLEIFADLHAIPSEVINQILNEEKSAYRLVENKIVQITELAEIAEIEGAVNNGDKYSVSSQHIKDALSLLANRSEPNYRNSIKESISAIESIAKVINGTPSATLGQALSKMRKEQFADPALLQGFEKIYGWSSDQQGIRHAMMDKPYVSFAEAKFFLVACSAFANYLKALDT